MQGDESYTSKHRRSSLNTSSSTTYTTGSPTSQGVKAGRLRSPPKVLSTVIFKDGSNRLTPSYGKSSSHYEFAELRSMFTESPSRRTKDRLYLPEPITQDQNATFTASTPVAHCCCHHKSRRRTKSKADHSSHKRGSSKRKSFTSLLKAVPNWKKDLHQILGHLTEHMERCSALKDKLGSKRIPLLEAFYKFNL
mmetsp:Transcript_25684/g.44988  ORF Transcript_25684/g.44988 Transcript_25684/m.44988 type:complete len:194 (-) Transcript_25684:7710-8291(-)